MKIERFICISITKRLLLMFFLGICVVSHSDRRVREREREKRYSNNLTEPNYKKRVNPIEHGNGPALKALEFVAFLRGFIRKIFTTHVLWSLNNVNVN